MSLIRENPCSSVACQQSLKTPNAPSAIDEADSIDKARTLLGNEFQHASRRRDKSQSVQISHRVAKFRRGPGARSYSKLYSCDIAWVRSSYAN